MGWWKTSKRQIIAHMGNSSQFPANTRASVLSAIEVGSDVVEIDVSKTKDGVAIAFHGKKLDYQTSGLGKVAGKEWGYIRSLEVVSHNGETTTHRIPLISELLDEFSTQTKWNLDLKVGLPDKDVVQKIRELHIQEKVVFSGLRIKDARKVIDLYPDLNVLINLSKLEHLTLGLRFLGEIFFRLRFKTINQLPAVIGINANHRLLSSGGIRTIKKAGAELWVYTVDDEKEALSLFDLGIDSVTTNNPTIMIQ